MSPRLVSAQPRAASSALSRCSGIPACTVTSPSAVDVDQAGVPVEHAAARPRARPMAVKEWPLPIGRTRRPAAAASRSTAAISVGPGGVDGADAGRALVARPVAPALPPRRAASSPSSRRGSLTRRRGAGQASGTLDPLVSGPGCCRTMTLRPPPTRSAPGWTTPPPTSTRRWPWSTSRRWTPTPTTWSAAPRAADPGGQQVGAQPRRAAPGARPARVRRRARLHAWPRRCGWPAATTR